MRQTLMIIGVWVMIVLHLGFPAIIDKFLLLATGLVIIAIAYKMRLAPKKDDRERPYVDNQPGQTGTSS